MEKKTKKTGASRTGSGSKTRTGTSKMKSRGAIFRSNGGSQEEKGERGGLFEKFFVDQLKDIYWAEKALVKALTKMAKESTSDELRQAFEDHKAETETQAQRLEEVFEMMEKRPQAKKCEAMAGIIAEAEEIISDTKDDTFTRDAGLIVAAQKVEHYEIASYGSLVQLARTLGKEDVAEVLEEILEEEKRTDELLTSIAESLVNEQAIQE